LKEAYMEAKKAVGLWEEQPKAKASIDKPQNPQREKQQSSTDDRRQPAKGQKPHIELSGAGRTVAIGKAPAKPKAEPKKEEAPKAPVTKKDE